MERAWKSIEEGRSAVDSVSEGMEGGDEEVKGYAPVAEDGEVGEGEVDGADMVVDQVVGYYEEEDCESVDTLWAR